MLEIDPKLVEAGQRLAAEHRELERERLQILQALRALPPEDRERREVREMIRELSGVSEVAVYLDAALIEMEAATACLPPAEELTDAERRELSEATYDLRDALADLKLTLGLARAEAA
jgi:hypothetical protein